MPKNTLIPKINSIIKPINNTKCFNFNLLQEEDIEYLSKCNISLLTNYVVNETNKEHVINIQNDQLSLNYLFNVFNIIFMCEGFYNLIGFDKFKNIHLPLELKQIKFIYELNERKYHTQEYSNINKEDNINNVDKEDNIDNVEKVIEKERTYSETDPLLDPDNFENSNTFSNNSSNYSKYYSVINKSEKDIYFDDKLSNVFNQLNNLNDGTIFFINIFLYDLFNLSYDINNIVEHNTFKINKFKNLMMNHIFTREELDIIIINFDVIQQQLQVFNILNININENIYSYPYHDDDQVNEAIEYIFDKFNSKLNALDRELVLLNKFMNIFDVIVFCVSVFSIFKLYIYYKHDEVDLFNNPIVNILVGLFFYIITRIYCHFI
jgi:hypothetical protein